MVRPYDRTTLLLFLFFLIVGLSLLANAVLIPLAGYWLHMRGGLKHFRLDALKGNRPQTAVSVRRELYHAFSSNHRVARPIVMFGDSLTAAGLWGEWYGTGVLNRGIGSETTQDALMRVPDIAALHPAKVFILFGTNDFDTFSADATLENMRQIVSMLRTTSPVSEIYIQSLLPPPSIDRASWISQVNDGYRQLADEYNLHWIDLYPAFADGPVINRRFTVDGVHLSPEGYDVWRRTVESYLKPQSEELEELQPALAR